MHTALRLTRPLDVGPRRAWTRTPGAALAPHHACLVAYTCEPCSSVAGIWTRAVRGATATLSTRLLCELARTSSRMVGRLGALPKSSRARARLSSVCQALCASGVVVDSTRLLPFQAGKAQLGYPRAARCVQHISTVFYGSRWPAPVCAWPPCRVSRGTRATGVLCALAHAPGAQSTRPRALTIVLHLVRCLLCAGRGVRLALRYVQRTPAHVDAEAGLQHTGPGSTALRAGRAARGPSAPAVRWKAAVRSARCAVLCCRPLAPTAPWLAAVEGWSSATCAGVDPQPRGARHSRRRRALCPRL